MQFTVTVKTDARAFLIEIIGVDTTESIFALKRSIEAVIGKEQLNKIKALK